MQLSRRQIIVYAALALVVVAVGVRYLVLPKASGPSQASAVVLAPVAASPSALETDASGSPAPADVVVYVCGAVRSPGVVRLQGGARVADALELAGGPSAKAELAAVNLAAPLSDGQQIVVPEKGAAAVAPARQPARPRSRERPRAGSSTSTPPP